MHREEAVALRERLRMRHHDAQLVERDAGSASRQCSIALITSPRDVQLPGREQIVGLVDRAGRGVLDRQQREIGGAAQHRGRTRVKGVVPGEQRAAGALRVAALRGEVRVAALDALVGDAQRHVLALAHEALLVRDRHVHDHAIHPLDLVRIDVGGGGDLAQARDQALLALPIAERARARELGLGDALDDREPLADQLDDLAIDRLDAVAQRREIWSRHDSHCTGVIAVMSRRAGAWGYDCEMRIISLFLVGLLACGSDGGDEVCNGGDLHLPAGRGLCGRLPDRHRLRRPGPARVHRRRRLR
jgi:hypothetical protein